MYILYSSDFKADIFISLNRKMFVTLCRARLVRNSETASMDEMTACILVRAYKFRQSIYIALVMERWVFFPLHYY